MNRVVILGVVLLVSGGTLLAQRSDPADPLLTVELTKRIDPQRYTDSTAEPLTEAEVLELLPIGFRIAPAPEDSGNDWVIICAETTEFVVEFTNGELSGRWATFHPSAKSQELTLKRFRELKPGMTKKQVERMFGRELERNNDVPSPNGSQKWRYVRGRELEVYLANGRVTGAMLKSYLDR